MAHVYHVDLAKLMHLYELNYIKLKRLLPDQFEINNQYRYQIRERVYQIKIKEITRYTSLILISQISIKKPLLSDMTVRLYHDAKMAEVCASERIFNIKARYDYPNKNMNQKDEKFRLNHFLGEWLSHCLHDGKKIGNNTVKR